MFIHVFFKSNISFNKINLLFETDTVGHGSITESNY